MYQAVYTLGNLFWLRYKLQEKFPSLTYPEINMSRNFLGPAIVARSRSRFYFFVTILATLQRIFPALCRGVTLSNVACNFSRNGSIKLSDKLQEKLPSVTAHLTCVQAFLFPCKGNRHPLGAVPPFVTAHTFCAKGICPPIQRYFCKGYHNIIIHKEN